MFTQIDIFVYSNKLNISVPFHIFINISFYSNKLNISVPFHIFINISFYSNKLNISVPKSGLQPFSFAHFDTVELPFNSAIDTTV
jgi:hypothetical protein